MEKKKINLTKEDLDAIKGGLSLTGNFSTIAIAELPGDCQGIGNCSEGCKKSCKDSCQPGNKTTTTSTTTAILASAMTIAKI